MPFKKGHRGRWGRKSAGSTRTSTPRRRVESDDEDIADPGRDVDTTGVDDHGDDDAPDDNNDDEEEDARENDEDDDDDDDGAAAVVSNPRKRKSRGGGGGAGAGRRSAPRNGFDTPDPAGDDDASDAGTPFSKRRRGRASGGGSTRRAAPGRKPRPVMDYPHVIVEGEKIEVVNDEALLDEDEEGNTKVDELGNLQGGREYRVRTFKIQDQGDRLYMLSTEPARCCGFRDSYLFFTKHPKLFKVLLTEPAKMDLIARDILPNSYKGRNIGVVTARSVFREFGARIIVGGRRVTDDYKVAEARADGVEEGVLADPEDRVPRGQEEYNRNRYVAWFGASDVYRQAASGAPGPDKKIVKRRNNVTIVNWQALHSKEASKFNSRIVAARKATHNGVYDNNTNILFFPSITQPTHARWKEVNDNEKSPDSIFKPLPAVITRNFAVVDTDFEAPPFGNAGYPGADGVITDPFAGTAGLSAVSDDLIEELPEECRKAFVEARKSELQWKTQWSNEARSTMRGPLKVGFVGYPV